MREAVEEKKHAYEVWMQRRNEESYERYKEKKRNVKRIVKDAKRRADVRWGNCLSEKFERNKRCFGRK